MTVREVADRERDALRGALTNVLSNASNFPQIVQSRLLGQDMEPLTTKVIDAVLGRGFHLNAGTEVHDSQSAGA